MKIKPAMRPAERFEAPSDPETLKQLVGLIVYMDACSVVLWCRPLGFVLLSKRDVPDYANERAPLSRKYKQLGKWLRFDIYKPGQENLVLFLDSHRWDGWMAHNAQELMEKRGTSGRKSYQPDNSGIIRDFDLAMTGFVLENCSGRALLWQSDLGVIPTGPKVTVPNDLAPRTPVKFKIKPAPLTPDLVQQNSHAVIVDQFMTGAEITDQIVLPSDLRCFEKFLPVKIFGDAENRCVELARMSLDHVNSAHSLERAYLFLNMYPTYFPHDSSENETLENLKSFGEGNRRQFFDIWATKRWEGGECEGQNPTWVAVAASLHAHNDHSSLCEFQKWIVISVKDLQRDGGGSGKNPVAPVMSPVISSVELGASTSEGQSVSVADQPSSRDDVPSVEPDPWISVEPTNHKGFAPLRQPSLRDGSDFCEEASITAFQPTNREAQAILSAFSSNSSPQSGTDSVPSLREGFKDSATQLKDDILEVLTRLMSNNKIVERLKSMNQPLYCAIDSFLGGDANWPYKLLDHSDVQRFSTDDHNHNVDVQTQTRDTSKSSIPRYLMLELIRSTEILKTIFSETPIEAADLLFLLEKKYIPKI